MDSKIQAEGVFFMFGIFSFFATIFTYKFIKETKHLNDKEKKCLYAPKEIQMADTTTDDGEDEFPKV